MLPSLKDLLPYLILVLVMVLGITSAYKDTKEKDELPKHFNKAVYAMFILLFILSALEIRQSTIVDRPYWYHGEIQGSEMEEPAFKLGGARFIPSDELETIFNLVGDPIKVWIYDGKLQLYAIIRNENGKQIVAVTGNNFVINPNTVSDFNYDEDSLEVLDKKGDVVLQVQMQNDGVLFCGIFHLIEGGKIALGNNVIEIRPPGDELETTFNKIFKYPGEDNLGVRVPVKTP